jgi:hypothetical protein
LNAVNITFTALNSGQTRDAGTELVRCRPGTGQQAKQRVSRFRIGRRQQARLSCVALTVEAGAGIDRTAAPTRRTKK